MIQKFELGTQNNIGNCLGPYSSMELFKVVERLESQAS